MAAAGSRSLRLVRSLVFNISMLASGLLLSLCGLVLWRTAPQHFNRIAKLWGRFCLWSLRWSCGVHVRVEGLAAMPAGPVIIAAQHQSAMDILIWLSLLPNPVFVLKQELCKIPLFGALLVPAGNIPVDREGGAPALRKMVVESRAALAKGHQVVIFPEGTRVAPGARIALHGGIVALTRIIEMPVIPAATNSGRCWGAREFIKNPGIVRVRLYPPLAPSQTRDEVIAQITACFYERGAG